MIYVCLYFFHCIRKQTNLRFKRLILCKPLGLLCLEIAQADGLNPTESGKCSLQCVMKHPLGSKCPPHCCSVEARHVWKRTQRKESELEQDTKPGYRVSCETLQCFRTTTHIARRCRHKALQHFAYFSFIVLCFGRHTCECKRCCGSILREESHSNAAVCAASGT